MPNYKRITADSPPRPTDDPAQLAPALEAAREELESLRVQRFEMRQVRNREGLAASNEAFQAAINKVNELEKKYYRAVAGPSGNTVVPVGTANEGEANG